MTSMDTIMGEFTVDKAKRLKKAYDRALTFGAKDDSILTFEGTDILMSFAKYLIEYLDPLIQIK